MAKIILFEAVRFGGKALVLKDQDAENLVHFGFNDVISSIIVIDGEWTLTHAKERGGTRWHVSDNGGPEGDGTYSHWNDWHGENDQMSSVIEQRAEMTSW